MVTPRFDRALLRGRCRRNLTVGLIVLCVGLTYGTWGAWQFMQRNVDAGAFDQPLVRAGLRMVPPPVHLKSVSPENDRELYLTTVISDQQDVLAGLALFILRMIVTLTFVGIGLVLLTAGATEWEVRSDLTSATRPRAAA